MNQDQEFTSHRRYKTLLFLSLFIIVTILCTSKFLLKNTDSNMCEMTYMWRQMYFMDIGFNKSSRYSLFLYGEGWYATKYIAEYGIFDGIPIIFVPGNAGSGRQVRSLGSVLQNKTDLRETNFHFDTFALDFNEEMTAISFEYLAQQSEYLNLAIDYVWSLYETKPPGIILIGHSMGGIVIKSLFLDPSFDRSKIAFVLTFATPFAEPPLLLNKYAQKLWKNLAELSHEGETIIPRVVSVNGGLKDEFVDETWTNLEKFGSASTSEIDRVWLEMDHQCILWCNQLVRHTSRVLFHYAKDPRNFLANFDTIVQRHYSTIDYNLEDLNQQDFREKRNRINSSLVYLNTEVLSLAEIFPRSTQFKMTSTIKILPLKFSAGPSLVYRVIIYHSQCDEGDRTRRIIFTINGNSSRFDHLEDNEASSAHIFVYQRGISEANYSLVFLDDGFCDNEVIFSLDFHYSAVKLLHRYREWLPLSISFASITIYLISDLKLTSVISGALSVFAIRHDLEAILFILFVNFVVMNIFFVIFCLFQLLISSIDRSKIPVINGCPHFATKLLILLTIFSLYAYTYPMAVICSFINLGAISRHQLPLPKAFALSALHLIPLVLQLPSAVTYVWNIAKYGEVIPHLDPSLETNLLIFMFTFLENNLGYSFFKSICSLNFSAISIVNYLILIVLVIFRNPTHFYWALDDASLIVSLCLGILWRPGARFTVKNKSE